MQSLTNGEFLNAQVLRTAERLTGDGPVGADRIASELGLDMATVVGALRSLAPDRLDVDFDDSGTATVRGLGPDA